MTAIPQLELNAELDRTALAAAYRRTGRIRIQRLLAAGAPEIYSNLEGERHWVQVLNQDAGTHEVAISDWEAPRSRLRVAIEREIYQRAIDGFQYSYAALRVPEHRELCGVPMLHAISEFMNSPAVVGFLEAVTGIRHPHFVDGQITAYSHGDFLTSHDDDIVGSARQAAFVFGLTPQWRPEWGGLLLFHDPGQIEISAMVPQFNTLDLFSVPRFHSVSQVTRAAPRRRFSLTGWLAA